MWLLLVHTSSSRLNNRPERRVCYLASEREATRTNEIHLVVVCLSASLLCSTFWPRARARALRLTISLCFMSIQASYKRTFIHSRCSRQLTSQGKCAAFISSCLLTNDCCCCRRRQLGAHSPPLGPLEQRASANCWPSSRLSESSLSLNLLPLSVGRPFRRRCSIFVDQGLSRESRRAEMDSAASCAGRADLESLRYCYFCDWEIVQRQ